jgi:hypothetical protein
MKNVVHRIVLDPTDRKSVETLLVQLYNLQTNLKTMGDRVAPRIVKSIRTRAAEPMLRILQIYPARQLGMEMHWKSERQRRYVMMKLRKENNLPYKRTGALARGWQYRVKLDDRTGKITFTVWNDAKTYDERTGKWVRYHRFVTGDIGIGKSRRAMTRYFAPIQPFHKDRGWQPSAPTISRAYEIAEKDALKIYEGQLERILEKAA